MESSPTNGLGENRKEEVTTMFQICKPCLAQELADKTDSGAKPGDVYQIAEPCRCQSMRHPACED